MVNFSRAAQNSAIKKSSYKHCMRRKPPLRNSHIIHKTALNTTKHLQVAGYKIFKNCQKLQFLYHCLTALLTDHSRKPRAQTKQLTVTILCYNSKLTGGMCLLGSDKCMPCALCLFFYLQSGCLSSSTSNEIISRR